MLSLESFYINEIMRLQQFRDWWREMRKANPEQFKASLENEEQWLQAFELYKKYASA